MNKVSRTPTKSKKPIKKSSSVRLDEALPKASPKTSNRDQAFLSKIQAESQQLGAKIVQSVLKKVDDIRKGRR